jgi:O-antigen ligase
MTHLFGILIFHALFMIFGFAAARGLKVIFMMFLGGAAIYAVVIVRYVIRFGDLMQGSYLTDIFGVGDRVIYIAFHQKIGIWLALAALSALGLASSRIKRILAIGALPLVLLFMFHIAARGALVALLCSLIFLMGAAFWVRSRKLALLGAAAAIVVAILASGIFYEYALHDKDIDPTAPDAISRTIREIQNPAVGLRQEIWTGTLHRILAEPNRLLLGRGIGMFPVDVGSGPPDWLLHPTAASRVYPHNVLLEMLYETGIVGLLLFTFVALFPLVVALKRWHLLSLMQKSAVSMYVFQIVGSEFSGSFAFSYLDPFFFALTVGIIALNRTENALVPGLSPSAENLDPGHPAQVAC